MHLTLLGQYALPGAPETTIHAARDIITVNGTAYDLSAVPEGGEGTWNGESPFDGPIRRIDGVLHVRVIAQLDATADLRQTAQWVIEDASGDITIPVARKQEVPA